VVEFYRETKFKEETEIGKIPVEWNVVRLGDEGIATIRRGKANKPHDYEEVAFIAMEKIPENDLYAEFEIKPMKDVKSFVYCEAGDILLAKITPCFENGKQGIVPGDVPNGFALATTEVYPIVCKGVNRFFLFYLLKMPKFRDQLKSAMRGTTGRLRVPKNAVMNLKVPLPSLEEQELIARILYSMDEAIQAVDASIAKYERLKRGLMQELLTKGIGHKEFKETEIGRIPANWMVMELRNVGSLTDGDWILKEDYTDSGVRLIQIGDIGIGKFLDKSRRFISLERAKELKCTFVRPGEDILISRMPDPIGRACLAPKLPYPYIVAVDITIFRVNRDIADPNYIMYALNDHKILRKIEKLSSGATRKRISRKNLERIKIPLPPLEEQKLIVKILLSVDAVLEEKRKKKRKLERMKKALMGLLLTGKVRVKA